MSRPRGSDLPAFPTPSQFQSSQQPAARPARSSTAQIQPQQQRPDPRYEPRATSARLPSANSLPPAPRHVSQGYDPRQSTESLAHDMRQASLGGASHRSTSSASHYTAHSQQRGPIVGIQPHTRATPATFHGQAFGIAPEATREPPYDKVLWNLFCQVDTDGSGAISPKELSGALINGNFTPFDIVTVQLMVRMFDEDRSGTISFAEFAKLWAYLLEWKQLFARFDTDASGTISFIEFSDALAAFGYRLSIEFAQFLFRHHERDRKQRTKEMTFDLFVQACITLRSYTDIFKAFDTDQDGVITIGFEDFLRVLIKNRS